MFVPRKISFHSHYSGYKGERWGNGLGNLNLINVPLSEAVSRKCSVKKLLLKTLQISQENTCARASKKLLHSCFPVNFAKFSRTAFLIEHLRWLMLLLF